MDYPFGSYDVTDIDTDKGFTIMTPLFSPG